MTPGLHLVAALPVMAVAETVMASKYLVHAGVAIGKGIGKAAKAAGSALSAGFFKIKEAAGKLRDYLGGNNKPRPDGALQSAFAYFADDEDGGEELSVEEVTKLGKEFWDELMEAYGAHLKEHEAEITKFLKACGKVKKKGVPTEKAEMGILPAAELLYFIQSGAVTFDKAADMVADLVANAPLSYLQDMTAELGQKQSTPLACGSVLIDHIVNLPVFTDRNWVIDGLPRSDREVKRHLAKAGVDDTGVFVCQNV